MKYLILLLSTISLVNCTHALHQYHVGDVEPHKSSRAKKITSSAEQFVIMGFATETNYVNQAFASLEKKCPKGRVTGIHTRYSTGHGFFSWTNEVNMTGLCVR